MSTESVESCVLMMLDKTGRARQDSAAVISVGRGTFWTMVDATVDVAFENEMRGADIAAVDSRMANYDAGAIYAPMFRKFGSYLSAQGITGRNLDTYLHTTRRTRMAEETAAIHQSAMNRMPNAAAVWPASSRTLATYLRSGTGNITSPTTGVPSATYGPTIIEALVNSVTTPCTAVFTLGIPDQYSSVVKVATLDLTGVDVGSIIQLGEQAIVSAIGPGSTAIGIATTAIFTINNKVLIREAGWTEIGKVTSVNPNVALALQSPAVKAFTAAAKVYPLFYKINSIANASGVSSGDLITLRPSPDRVLAY